MQDVIREAGPVSTSTAPRSRRAVSIFAALALVLGGVALAHGADPDTPKTSVVTNIDDGRAVVDGAGATLGRTLGFGAAVAPQFNVGAIVCGILDAILSGPLGSLLGGFLAQILAPLRIAFGCTS